MKKLLSILFIGLLLTSFSFAQQARKSTQNKDSAVTEISVRTSGTLVQFDIFFSSPIDTRSLASSNITINDKPFDSRGAKITFNRECTQIRFVLKATLPVSITVDGIKAVDGTPIPPITANNVNGDTTWKAN